MYRAVRNGSIVNPSLGPPRLSKKRHRLAGFIKTVGHAACKFLGQVTHIEATRRVDCLTDVRPVAGEFLVNIFLNAVLQLWVPRWRRGGGGHGNPVRQIIHQTGICRHNAKGHELKQDKSDDALVHIDSLDNGRSNTP